MPEGRYEAAPYWEGLLGDKLDLSGVGYPGLPVSFNRCFYRAQADAVHRALSSAGVDPSPSWSVLDVGSGSGFWVDFWHRAGVREITGVDLTQSAVTQLRGRYPQDRFERVDISTDTPWEEEFDVISAMSVLLHIKEGGRFQRALGNLGRALKPGGALVLIDPLVVHRWWGSPFGPEANSIARPRADWVRALDDHGLEIVAMLPATILLANVVDTRHRLTFRLLDRYWQLLGLVLPRLGERGGRWVGEAIYLLDKLLVRAVRPGPSAKCLVIRAKR